MSTSSTSCSGCKYLYHDGQGYSDYTWMETFLVCAKNMNNVLPKELPWDYGDDVAGTLRWLAILAGRCEMYASELTRQPVVVSPDGNINNFTDDDEQMRAIIADQQQVPAESITDDALSSCRRFGNLYGRELGI